MALNRLFIYDPESNSAVCIAKGYSCGWGSNEPYIDSWFSDNPEYDVPASTRYQLKTEGDLPADAKLVYQT